MSNGVQLRSRHFSLGLPATQKLATYFNSGSICGFELTHHSPINTYLQNRYSSHIIPCMAKNPEHRDLFPGALEIMILQSLRRKPMHGYALVKHIKQVSDNLLQVEEGSLYPALQRMLREGWLESEIGTSAKGRPTRIYRLTNAGIQHLEREVVSFEKMFAGITRVLAAAQA
jgi:PadR family transcriptional regulator PadR